MAKSSWNANVIFETSVECQAWLVRLMECT
jgi:hypothetical protein